MSAHSKESGRKLCYRSGTPVRFMLNQLSKSKSVDINIDDNDADNDEHIPRRPTKRRRLSTIMSEVSELAYYYDHVDELDPVWDGSRRHIHDEAHSSQSWKLAVEVVFDEAIFERQVPLHPASKEVEEQVDPLCLWPEQKPE